MGSKIQQHAVLHTWTNTCNYGWTTHLAYACVTMAIVKMIFSTNLQNYNNIVHENALKIETVIVYDYKECTPACNPATMAHV